jgi:DNA recombination protein RmuC
MTIIIVLASVIITAVIAFMLHKDIVSKKVRALTAQIELQSITIGQLTAQKNKLEDDRLTLTVRVSKMETATEIASKDIEAYKQLMKDHQDLVQQAAAFSASLKAKEELLQSQKEDMQRIGEKFQFEFKNLAQNILEEKTKKFTEVNEEKIKAILDPLKSELGQFKQKVEETYDKESKERFSLGKEVQRLIEMSQTVSQEANNLTTALKGNSKMQGNWGEMILESLLENSGLSKGREYFVQEYIRDNAGNVVKDENGKGLQPDVTICYPDERKVIIDSKVSLVAWDAFVAETDVEQQQEFLDEHIKCIRHHIDSLSRKNYPKYAQALDYVLLFIPIEPAFLEAVKSDVNLWKYAYEKKILLVSPTNLFAVLKIIADLWKVELQNKHAIEIANKAGALYDKFVLFVENMETVGKKLEDANESYASAFKQLSTGRGNLIGKIEELKRMGANATKQLSDKFIVDANGLEER